MFMFVFKGTEVDDTWNTPKDTIKGVNSSIYISDEDFLNSDIMSIAKEIQKDHNTNDMITEQVHIY